MQRLVTSLASTGRKSLNRRGLHYHTFDGVLYWDESVCYQFEADEIDAIEAATYELDRMCLEAVEAIIDEGLWEQFSVPKAYRDWIRWSWENDKHTIVGRFDLAYDGSGYPKMLEYNADTPTGFWRLLPSNGIG